MQSLIKLFVKKKSFSSLKVKVYISIFSVSTTLEKISIVSIMFFFG